MSLLKRYETNRTLMVFCQNLK